MTDGDAMARAKGKTEHAGAKNGGGAMWGKRAEVKADSNKRRRASAKDQIAAQIFEAQETIKRNMDQRTMIDEIARMSGNDTAAGYIDAEESRL